MFEIYNLFNNNVMYWFFFAR